MKKSAVDRETAIRDMCAAANLPNRARRYISSGRSVKEVRKLLFQSLLKRQGPEIEIPSEIHMRRLNKMIDWEIAKAQRIQEAFAIISTPKTRKELLRIIETGGASLNDELLALEARGIYPLVCRDVIDANGKWPRDIDDYLKSRAWLRKFNKGSKGGPVRRVPPEWLAVRLAWWFEQFTGTPRWNLVAQIIRDSFPGVFSIPDSKIHTKSKYSTGYRQRRWAKELTKRYCRWSKQFREKEITSPAGRLGSGSQIQRWIFCRRVARPGPQIPR